MRRILIIGAALGALAFLGGSGLPSSIDGFDEIKLKEVSPYVSSIAVDRDEVDVIDEVLIYQHSHMIIPVPFMAGVYINLHDP